MYDRKKSLVSIIILNWNGSKFIYDCINSIRHQTYPNIEVIIVDNSSTDGSIQLIENENPDFNFVKNSENLGYCKGMNMGIAIARGEFVIPLNYDIVMHERFVEECIKAISCDDKIGVVGGQAYDWIDGKLTNNLQKCCRYVKKYIRSATVKNNYSRREPPCVHGSFPFIRKKALDDLFSFIGEYFDPDFITAWEDLDLWFRFKLRGWKKIFWPDARVWHFGSAAWNGKKGFVHLPVRFRAMTLRNRHAIIIQDLPTIIILRFLPLLIVAEIAVVFFFLFKSPSSLKALIQGWKWTLRDFKLMMKKRKILKGARTVSIAEIMKMFKDNA